MTDSNNLVRLTKSQINPAARMLARAFCNEPVYVYFMPDVSYRRKKLPQHFAVRLRHCVSSGEAYVTLSNLEGSAMWFPPEYSKLTIGKIMMWAMFPVFSACLTRPGREALSRQLHVKDYLDSVHIRAAPFRHWYLSSIGIAPVYQRKGYADRLLKPMLARMDAERLPCYLETQKEENLAFYRHYGFRVVDEGVIPGTTIRNWAMLREEDPVDLLATRDSC